jgi:hypothetical protein
MNTTLAATWPVSAQQEDYFTWGPANLIYFPEKINEKYMQPGVYAVLPTDETVEKVLARERQQYDKRRNIITYANYRNLLVIIQNQPSECVRVVDGNLPEISPRDDDRFRQMAPYSEIEHVLADARQRTPPSMVFGSEPEHAWCYYYEKASLARQQGDWEEVRRLGEEAQAVGVYDTKYSIEWIPFIQSYAVLGDFEGIDQIASKYQGTYLDRDECESMLHPAISVETQKRLQTMFCQNSP